MVSSSSFAWERARTTKDIDLRLVGPPAGLLERLRRAAGLELGDFMVFTVAPDAEHPAIANEGMLYGGQRHRVTCTLAGKPYGQMFGLDIAFADPMPRVFPNAKPFRGDAAVPNLVPHLLLVQKRLPQIDPPYSRFASFSMPVLGSTARTRTR